ncbi:MAG: sigma-54 dependent transcriptional regulator [Syntrophobacteraceae bacterium]|nr:sigma-54 dependent transcriptional regulator [Desulfobacteraceae bacterium]
MSKTLYPSQPVLLVDDEIEGLRSLELALRSGGISNIVQCLDSREVMPMLAEREICAILLDLSMPYICGEEILPRIVQEYPEIPVIISTATNEVQTAVRCMQAKAYDYMVKPIEKSRLISGVTRAIEMRELQNDYLQLKSRMLSETLEKPQVFSTMITRSNRMHSLFQYAESIASSPHPLLISGETGVGKELMAEAIHKLSCRTGPLISVNVAGIDDTAFSDTLFGHKRGAFTGAVDPRKGLVERAAGGTLHLDEIGDLSSDSQIKLLRLVQEREYFPLGSDVPKVADTRIIVSTNQDLQALLARGLFRKDLFYRLRTHHLHIPPLRERLEDLPLLVEHFLCEAAASLDRKMPPVTADLLCRLSSHSFPGNVRELRAMIYDALGSGDSMRLSFERLETYMERGDPPCVQAGQSPFASVSPAVYSDLEPLPTLKEAMQMLIGEAMRRTSNNQSMAARLLGISRQRLGRRLKDGTDW